MEDPVVITAAVRTAMGAYQSAFKEVPAQVLGAAVITAVLEGVGMDPTDVGEVYLGNVLAAGLGQAPVRQAALLAGLPPSVPCSAISKICGSGMLTVMLAHDLLRAGTLTTAIVGGMENMSRAPLLLGRERGAYQAGLRDHLLLDCMLDACTGQGSPALGRFADAVALTRGVCRADQDDQSIISITRARAAQASGAFEREIVPVKTPGGSIVSTDEHLTRAQPERVPTLVPLFPPNGTVTAATAAPFSDGAAALLLTLRSLADERGLPIRAVVRGHASHAQAPEQFITAPVGAVCKLLLKTGWEARSVDLFEIGEGFALGVLVVAQELGIDLQRVNVHGGACALGHPIGATGARLIVTLLHALEHHGLRRGIATLCMGGGEATAIALELPA